VTTGFPLPRWGGPIDPWRPRGGGEEPGWNGAGDTPGNFGPIDPWRPRGGGEEPGWNGAGDTPGNFGPIDPWRPRDGGEEPGWSVAGPYADYGSEDFEKAGWALPRPSPALVAPTATIARKGSSRPLVDTGRSPESFEATLTLPCSPRAVRISRSLPLSRFFFRSHSNNLATSSHRSDCGAILPRRQQGARVGEQKPPRSDPRGLRRFSPEVRAFRALRVSRRCSRGCSQRAPRRLDERRVGQLPALSPGPWESEAETRSTAYPAINSRPRWSTASACATGPTLSTIGAKAREER
jgi:hypothetical protein